MQRTHIFIGLAILLWGTTSAIGQDFFGLAQCDPCVPASNACGLLGNGASSDSPFSFGGWVEMGVYTNSHGSRSNGPIFSASHERTDFQMNQLFIFGEKELNTKRGFDWGGRVDVAYGTDYDVMQTADGTFDDGWGVNRHGYGLAIYNLYGTLGYKDLSVTVGKFVTLIGWEAVAAKDNLFYSHSYCYMIEPSTHTGVFATYDLTDRLSLTAGWTTGRDSSFKNPNGNSAALFGFDYSLAKNASIIYMINAGKEYNDSVRTDYFIQSLCFEWALTKRFTYVMQYNLGNNNERGGSRTSAYGINNHFLYKLTDKLTAGTRVEWFRDNAHVFDAIASDYWQVTLGLRWDATGYLSFRPEVRYSWCNGGATPFADSTRRNQISGGCGMIISF